MLRTRPVLGREEPEAPASLLEESKDIPPGRLPSPHRRTPVSLEAIAIAIAVTALIAWHLYAALEPHISISRIPTESEAPHPSEQHRSIHPTDESL